MTEAIAVAGAVAHLETVLRALGCERPIEIGLDWRDFVGLELTLKSALAGQLYAHRAERGKLAVNGVRFRPLNDPTTTKREQKV